MKNLHQLSSHDRRARRYPFLVAIDLLVHLTLSLSALVLTVVAFALAFDAFFPGIVRIPPFWLHL